MMRRTPLRKVGKVKARTLAAEQEFRTQVKANANGWCQGATPACPPYRHEGHHAHHCAISDRRKGVHEPARGLWLCSVGHSWAHANPQESYLRGLLLRSGA